PNRLGRTRPANEREGTQARRGSQPFIRLPVADGSDLRFFDDDEYQVYRRRFATPEASICATSEAFARDQVRIAGNSTTSRRLRAPVSSITRRSIPRPTPAVGGIPYSSASMKASSNGWVSSSP